jgi:acyl dehydratase
MSRLVVTSDELAGLAGRDLGVTDYVEITQERIDAFADITNDHQWIHTDPVRAKDGPFGTTIAHGFLTLALIVPFWTELLDVEGLTAKVNYGLDRVRFVAPVPVGARIRMHSVVESVEEVKGAIQLATANTIEIEGGQRPALVATFLARFYP